MPTDTAALALGLDIGTSSISAAVISLREKSQVAFYTVANQTDIASDEPAFHLQNAELIWEKALSLVHRVMTKYPHIKSIGLTGQMHGILYVDDMGRALSPLMTWQDNRAQLPIDGQSSCERILRLCGAEVPPGYGLATHYYNCLTGLVPRGSCGLCSIMDYIVMRLTGASRPVVHSSVAASFGLFDLSRCRFQTEKLEALGISPRLMPRVTDEFLICGCYRGARVSVAIGDNQASFLGTVRELDTTVLVNIGTGSQICAVTASLTARQPLEIRPLVKGKYIVCGSALCGGASYALLEGFFREFSGTTHSQYDTLNRLAGEAYARHKPPLLVNTWFRGKRHDPQCTGSIVGITPDNFTPGQLALGFICGICQELKEYFQQELQGKDTIAASGNAVQKIPVFRDVLAERFALEVQLSAGKEEASLGAALFSLVAAGLLEDVYCFRDFIHYK